MVVPWGGTYGPSGDIRPTVDGYWRMAADTEAALRDLLAAGQEVLLVAVGERRYIDGAWVIDDIVRHPDGTCSFAIAAAARELIDMPTPVSRQQGVRYVSPDGPGRDAFLAAAAA